MKYITIFAVALSLIATPVLANPPAGWNPSAMGVPTSYPANHSPRYPYNYDYRRDRPKKHNDDIAWAVGGMIVGAIIMDQINKNKEPKYSQPLPPPQKRKVVTCSDEVAYDQAGNPYVKRQCYESWM